MVDPYLQASFSFRNRLRRYLWGVTWFALARFSPRPFHKWRLMLIRAFGGAVDWSCAIYPGAKIWAPWNLVCEDTVAIADGVEVYNPSRVVIRSHAIISQGAYLCGATHDLDNPDFPLTSDTIEIGRYGWVCAKATVLPGVVIGEGGVLGLGSVATKNIPAWNVWAGVPARYIRLREHL